MIDTHYVVGSRAPFIFRAGTKKSKGNRHATAIWAVYAGQYAANASNMVQGGAVAASEFECLSSVESEACYVFMRAEELMANETPLEVFDFTTACYGSMLYPREGGAFGMTKRLTVRYLRPVQPVPGVFKILIDAKSIDEEKGELKVQASLFPPTSPFAESPGVAGGGGGDGGGNRGQGADRKGENKERPFAVAEVELIDLRRRKRWKAAYRNKTAGRGRANL